MARTGFLEAPTPASAMIIARCDREGFFAKFRLRSTLVDVDHSARRRQSTRYVEDSASLRAIAHPLRLELLGRLRAHGPATASALGRALGESSGSTSYHLRQLERFGFIEPDPKQPSRREKVWRAAHESTDFRMWNGAGPGEQAAIDTIVAVQVEHLMDGVRRRQRSAATTGKEWNDAHASSDMQLRITAEGMRRLKRQINELVEAAETPRDADARWVSVHLQSFLRDDDAVTTADDETADDETADDETADDGEAP